MNIKQAKQMLSQIKESGLQNNTKVAQELVRELELFIKSAGMKKQADLRWYTQSGTELKKIFFYWASAALSEMTSESELQGMTIPPVGSDDPTSYGTKIFNLLPRRSKRQASVAQYANFLNNLYEQVKPALIKSINDTYGSFVNNNKEFQSRSDGRVELDNLWQIASTWAVTGKDVVARGSEGRSKNISPWKRIGDKVEGGGSIAERVMGAIRKGVFSAMASKGRYLSLSERREMGMVEVDGQKIRYESTEGKSKGGEEYSKLDQFSAQGHIENLLGVSNAEKYMRDEDLSEESLNAIEGLLTGGSLDNSPLRWLKGLEGLLLSDHINKDDALITDTLKPNFFEGKYNGDETYPLAKELLEMTGNPITDELEELIRSYYSGELDEASRLDAEYDLVNDGWMIDNIEVSVEAEQAVEMIVEQAEEMAEQAVGEMNLPSGELGEVIKELNESQIALANIKRISRMFTEEGFHWMLDANLYLDETEWVTALREADIASLRAIQDTIEEHQEPLLPLGLRHIFNSAIFADPKKMKGIKEFADQCMDQAVVERLFSGKAPLTWFIELAIQLNGGSTTVSVDNKSFKIEVPKMRFFNLNTSTFEGVFNALIACKDGKGGFEQAKVNIIVKHLKDLIEPYVPKAYGDLNINISDLLQSIMNIIYNDKYKTDAKKIGQALKSTRNSGIKSLKGFYSGIASELVRYRFYLDIGLTEGNNIPKGLGNADCDNRVLLLIGPIPRNEINAVKSQSYEEFILPVWRQQVNQALSERLTISIADVNKNRKLVRKVFEKFGIVEGTELYEAFVDLS